MIRYLEGKRHEKKRILGFYPRQSIKEDEKQEKRLKYYARIYFGEPMAIVYARNGAKIVHGNGTESEIMV